MSGRRASYVILVLVAMSLLGVVIQAVRFAFFPDPKLSRLAERQFETQIWMTPRRGSILDRNGEPLAINQDVFSVAASPRVLKSPKRVSSDLARTLGIEKAELLRKLKKNRSFVWIKRHLSEHEVASLKKKRILQNGLWLVQETKRVYPHGTLASSLLGDVNIDNTGIEGIELWKNESLRGVVAQVPATRDALGRPSALDAGLADEVEDGKPLRLTIDSGLQNLIESTLEQHVLETRSDQGLVAVMDAESGDLLSIAQYPFFDRTSAGTRMYRRNRFFTDTFEPGSTMKPFLVGAALMYGRSSDKKIWAERGEFKVGKTPIREAHSDDKFEWLSLRELIEVSSNIASAKLALETGAPQVLAGYRFFGFGDRSELNFPGESAGALPTLPMRPLRLANIGFGQGLVVTSIQMLQAFSVVASGGDFVRPRLVVEDEAGRRPSLKRLPPEIASEIEAGLLKVTEKGTGRAAAPEGIQVAGKTGTAQVVDPTTKRYSKEHYITSFVGYPVGLERKIVILAQLDHPRSSRYAASTAAPLFRAALEQTLSRLNVPRPRTLYLSESSQLETTRSAPTRNYEESREMPELASLGARSVLRKFEGFPVKWSIQGEGWVVEQEPKAGTLIRRGDTVRIKMSTLREERSP